jgi:5-methyltetrahydrofolate--homocysteine methyltransferase
VSLVIVLKEVTSMIDCDEIKKRVIEGDSDRVSSLTKVALEAGIPAIEILNGGLLPGISHIGVQFSEGTCFLPELLVSGDAVNAGLKILRPVLSKGDAPPAGKYLIGTVQGDVHDIGKNIVTMMLEAHGWEVTDLGVDVSPERFCSEIEKGDYDILGISALLTSTMSNAGKTIEALKAQGIRNKIRVMVGGAPVTQAFADEMGADGFAPDAAMAVKVAANLVK